MFTAGVDQSPMKRKFQLVLIPTFSQDKSFMAAPLIDVFVQTLLRSLKQNSQNGESFL